MKKKLLAALCIILICSFFASCTKDVKTSGGNGYYDKATIKFGFINAPTEKFIAEKLANTYMKLHKEVKIELVPYDGDYNGKVITEANAGNLPDVIFSFDDKVGQYAQNKIFLPLDDHMKALGIKRSDYYENFLALGTYVLDKKQYILPREYSHLVTAVNKTILDSENIEMPKDDWTFDDYLTICKKVAKKDSAGTPTQYGAVVYHTWDPVWTSFSLGFGGTMYDTATKKLTMSNTNTVKGLEALFEMVKSGVAYNGFTVGATSDPFLMGTAAFEFVSKPGLPQINTEFAKLNMEWDILPFPTMPNKRVVGSGTVGYGVSAKTKNEKQAAAFVCFTLSEEGQKALMETGSVVPMLKSLRENPMWRNYPVPNKNSEAFVYKPEDDCLDVLYRYLTPDQNEDMRTQFSTYQQKIFANEISVTDAMRALDALINKTS